MGIDDDGAAARLDNLAFGDGGDGRRVSWWWW